MDKESLLRRFHLEIFRLLEDFSPFQKEVDFVIDGIKQVHPLQNYPNFQLTVGELLSMRLRQSYKNNILKRFNNLIREKLSFSHAIMKSCDSSIVLYALVFQIFQNGGWWKVSPNAFRKLIFAFTIPSRSSN